MEENIKSKFLFLHGYAQNSQIFNLRTKNLQKQLLKKFNNKYEILIPDAPLILDKDNQIQENEILRGWLTFDKVDDFYGRKLIKYYGLSEAIDNIYKLGDNNKNIEMILSFSQGSVVLILMIILSLYNNDKYNFNQHFPNLKCIICVSGFIRPFPDNDEFKDIIDEVFSEKETNIKKCQIPILNVYGENDQFVLNDKSQEISKFFTYSEDFCHKGKHFVPSSKGDIIKFEEFLEKYLK